MSPYSGQLQLIVDINSLFVKRMLSLVTDLKQIEYWSIFTDAVIFFISSDEKRTRFQCFDFLYFFHRNLLRTWRRNSLKQDSTLRL